MGLDTSHDCWHGSYGAFTSWRKFIAAAAGLPPLGLMEGFYGPGDDQRLKDFDSSLPIKWECLKPSPLHKLLNHSDCDGEIKWNDCGAIADILEKLLPRLTDDIWKARTVQFVAGLRLAASKKENVDFH